MTQSGRTALYRLFDATGQLLYVGITANPQVRFGLRAERPWARLAPDTLVSVTFGPGVTIYDLFAPDRDERVRAAFAEGS